MAKRPSIDDTLADFDEEFHAPTLRMNEYLRRLEARGSLKRGEARYLDKLVTEFGAFCRSLGPVPQPQPRRK